MIFILTAIIVNLLPLYLISFFLCFILNLVWLFNFHTQPVWLPGLFVYFPVGYIGLMLFIGITPLAIVIARYLENFHIPSDREYSKISPLVNEVINRQKDIFGINKSIKNYRIYVSNTPGANAYAIGLNIIVLTTDLLKLDDETVAAVVAHELGHLRYKDSIIKMFYLLIDSPQAFFRGALAFLNPTIDMLLTASNKYNEYKADWYAKTLGYKQGLIKFLKVDSSRTESFLHTHPCDMNRIRKLNTDNYKPSGIPRIIANLMMLSVLCGTSYAVYNIGTVTNNVAQKESSTKQHTHKPTHHKRKHKIAQENQEQANTQAITSAFGHSGL